MRWIRVEDNPPWFSASGHGCKSHIQYIVRKRSFLVIDGLFTRYTIIVEPVAGITSVYCDVCEQWVAQYYGEQITTHTSEELYEKIISDHKEDFPTRVEFASTERFK